MSMKRTCPISSRASPVDILRSLEHQLTPPLPYSLGGSSAIRPSVKSHAGITLLGGLFEHTNHQRDLAGLEEEVPAL